MPLRQEPVAHRMSTSRLPAAVLCDKLTALIISEIMCYAWLTVEPTPDSLNLLTDTCRSDQWTDTR